MVLVHFSSNLEKVYCLRTIDEVWLHRGLDRPRSFQVVGQVSQQILMMSRIIWETLSAADSSIFAGNFEVV